MATKRTKKVVVTGVSKEMAETAFAEFAIADAKVQGITAKMDGEITRIREKYADTLSELNEAKEKAFEVMQTYAMEQKDVLFVKRKSVESAHGVFGFRTGNPKLKRIKGYTWDDVTNKVKELLPEYIRISEELAKDKLLSDRKDPDVAEMFPRIGIQVVQEDTFYIELKKESDAAETA